jgi:hypothetical protein
MLSKIDNNFQTQDTNGWSNLAKKQAEKKAEQSTLMKVLEGINNLNKQQAKQQAEQAKQQAEQAKQQAKFEATVIARLDRIEKNTVTIMSHVISDFAGISESTKKELESHSQELESLDPEVVHAYATDNEVRKEVNQQELGKSEKKPGQKGKATFATPVINVGKIAASYNPALTAGERKAAGNWCGNIMNKVYPKTKFSGNYHPRLAGVVNTLMGYYTAERESVTARKY